MKTSEKRFQGYRNGTLAYNGLNDRILHWQISSKHQFNVSK